MVDENPSSSASPSRCPWCSAELPSQQVENCPSCNAALKGPADANVPGVTAIDAEAIVRAARAPAGGGRNRLLGWISGEYPEEEMPPPEGSLAPPPPEVRREMLRLAIEAEVANLQAEVTADASEARIEGSPVPTEAAAEVTPETLLPPVASEAPQVPAASEQPPPGALPTDATPPA